ncbi:MAG: hypothetical protein WD077_11510 [Bacteroidia bacterium]
MTSTALLTTAASLIRNSFSLVGASAGNTHNETLEALHAALTHRISEMLQNDPGLLSNILYRIDVAETTVREITERQPPGDVPFQLATLIIERQLEKAKWRAKMKDSAGQ